MATTEAEWRKRFAPRPSDASSKPARNPDALFCRFEVDNVFDR